MIPQVSELRDWLLPILMNALLSHMGRPFCFYGESDFQDLI